MDAQKTSFQTLWNYRMHVYALLLLGMFEANRFIRVCNDHVMGCLFSTMIAPRAFGWSAHALQTKKAPLVSLDKNTVSLNYSMSWRHTSAPHSRISSSCRDWSSLVDLVSDLALANSIV